MTKHELIKRQNWSLNQKIDHTLGTIEQFYNHFEGKVYVSFSGGKDSTVLLHLVRRLFPDAVGVFSDTGLEYPEIREFVKQTDNIETIRPKKPFTSVIKDYGYPVISKEQSQFIGEYMTTKSDKLRDYRINGNKSGGGKISKKWLFMTKAAFKVSHKCCHVLKKEPFKRFEKETGLNPIIGTMAEESSLRVQSYLKNGCNAFETNRPQSNPIMFWKEEDVWEYIKRFNVPYSKIYDMGYQRTGCMFCMYGVQREESPNRFQKMKITHPKQYEYCINKLGIGEVLDFIGVEY